MVTVKALSSLRKLALLTIVLSISGCLLVESDQSREFLEYQAKNPNASNLAQVRFSMDSLGSLSLSGLAATAILPIKVYGTALLIVDNQESGGAIDGKRLPEVMRKYGFLNPEKIENWKTDWAPAPRPGASLGFIHSDMKREIEIGPIDIKSVQVEVANITCATCHAGTTYDANGLPTGNVWLGSPNTSLNFDGFLNDIFKGLKIAAKDRTKFMATIRKAYPQMPKLEASTIEDFLLRAVEKEIKKLSAMNKVLPFPNGGPGLTNGIGAFKRNAKLLDKPYRYDHAEAGFISIPDISFRGFRSNLTADGAYAVKGQPRFERIDAAKANDPAHLTALSKMAAFFTFPSMGNRLENIEANLPNVERIFDFLSVTEPPDFPGQINETLALAGGGAFKRACASCHGDYTDGLKPRLVSFPNAHIPQEKMGTDPVRWQMVTSSIQKFSDRNVLSKYIDAGYRLGGYVAPILSGLWASAPYLHNGSVPTLWHFLHPESRPAKFSTGGHSLDFEKVGIRGVVAKNGSYLYPAGFKPWARATVYDTAQPGRSNKGHENQVKDLTEPEKTALLEYLKLL